MKTVDWVIAHDGTQGRNAYALECLRCGTVQHCCSPIAVSAWMAAANTFRRYHRRCKEHTQMAAKSERRRGANMPMASDNPAGLPQGCYAVASERGEGMKTEAEIREKLRELEKQVGLNVDCHSLWSEIETLRWVLGE